MSQAGRTIAQLARESWFWTGVLRDHVTFIHDALAPQEERAAGVAAAFQQRLGTLHDEVEAITRSMGVTGPAGSWALADRPAELPLDRFQGVELRQAEQSLQGLRGRLTESVQSVRSFKEELLQRKLSCRITLNLGPSLLQHMINETDEAYRTLSGLREAANLPPPLEALHHHLLWLPDAAGHAAALHGGLDGTEQKLLDETDQFKRIFTGMELKAIELYSMLRIAPRMVGALRRLNRDSMTEIATFRAFLAEMRELLEGCEILGTITPLFADHMLREELYYTEKIAMLKEE